ncbi:MAG TPA: M20/M25/M40 family metallo-hydrolase [Bryobacteraceae bacterium]|nr:M20/M25/M40 family metallo-hydrolase [Bryobacteraceae bacterium]
MLSRLQQAPRNNHARASALAQLFADAGCAGEHLVRESVKHRRDANVICVLPGGTEQRILVTAHTDKADEGYGVVDDWSGASMLADLLESLRTAPRRHTFVFIGFTAEEDGLAGSRFYVKTLTAAERSRIGAVVNVECLGLSPTAVWLHHADPRLAQVAGQAAATVKLPIRAINVERVGEDDAMSFAAAHIPTITFHSVTQETLQILHSPQDTYRAIHPDEYYDSYHLLAAYLALADVSIEDGASPASRR